MQTAGGTESQAKGAGSAVVETWEAWSTAWQGGERKEVKWKVRPGFVGHGGEFGIIYQV